jgi:serine/threonine-protein kinase
MISEITGQVPEERTDKAFDRSAALVGVALDGRYRVTELVGAGETSCLYNGFDRFRNIPVAIKVLHRHLVTRAGFIDRFDDEASSPDVLGSYPSVTRIIEQRVLSTGQPYVVMERTID